MFDPRERKKIEEAAIREVSQYYGELGYDIRDRQKHCVGWDLEADLNGTALLLEVKGTSSTSVNVELTSNEFSQMKKNRTKGYRICIVSDALGKKPSLSIYRFVPETKQWEHHETGAALVIEPVVVLPTLSVHGPLPVAGLTLADTCTALPEGAVTMVNSSPTVPSGLRSAIPAAPASLPPTPHWLSLPSMV